MSAQKKNINLLPQEEFEASIIGRLLKWAMSTFRIIVIVTEMVVMGAFLSRFWLDAKNSDLNETIDVKVSQIESQEEFEQTFRGLQKKLDVYAKVDALQKNEGILQKITSRVPADISLSSISTQDGQAQIKGIANSELAIAQFISNLKAEKDFKNVDLGQLSSSETNQSLTVFSIKISI